MKNTLHFIAGMLIFVLAVILLGGCRSTTQPADSVQSQQSTVFYILAPWDFYAHPDTLVFTNGVLDSDRAYGFSEQDIQLDSTLEPSEQVYYPNWTPFAFEVFLGDALTFAWSSPAHDTIGIGDYDITDGYAASYIPIYVRSK